MTHRRSNTPFSPNAAAPENLRLQLDAPAAPAHVLSAALHAVHLALAGAGIPLSRCFLQLNHGGDADAAQAITTAEAEASAVLQQHNIDTQTARLVLIAQP